MITAVVTIVMFLVLITIHEFGHFAAAKAVGIKVLEFAVGMGPVLLKKQRGETLYSIRALPIGGYCKMEGEDCESEDERGFTSKPVWQRMIVVLAGATLNLVLGLVLMIIIVANSQSFSTNIVDTVEENSYLNDAGVQSGDKIVGFNGHKIGFYQDIALYTSEMSADTPVDLQIKRGKEKINISVMPSVQRVVYEYTDTGINVREFINGSESERFVPYSDTLIKSDELVGTTEESQRNILGFIPKTEDVTPFNIVPEAFRFTRFVVRLVYVSVFKMITGKLGVNQLSGPVGIVAQMNEAVHTGAIDVLYLVALITINLGVFNLLPIPALDGGRFLFMIIELIRRKPVPPEKEGLVHMIGFALLMLLSVFALYNDIVRLISK